MRRELAGLEKLLRIPASEDPVCRLLINIPGVGHVMALTHISAIDDLEPFRISKDIRSWMELTPGQDSPAGGLQPASESGEGAVGRGTSFPMDTSSRANDNSSAVEDGPNIALTVNGVTREAPIPTDETLLDTIRVRLGLTGAKRGCDQGVCGACTVMVDGQAVRACLSLSVNCTGLEIVTAEGLANGGILDPVQRALVESGAIQCGFCTPGLAIAARALLNENPEPTVDEIRVAVSGNLCRCSGYVKIVEAIGMATRG